MICTLAAFSLALDTSTEELVQEIGHDGTEIIWPGASEPRRSFHWQEFIQPCLNRGYALVMIEFAPSLGSDSPPYQWVLPIKQGRFSAYLELYTGVLIGEVYGQMHAVYWNRRVIDPNGLCSSLQELHVREFLALISTIQSKSQKE